MEKMAAVAARVVVKPTILDGWGLNGRWCRKLFERKSCELLHLRDWQLTFILCLF